MLFHSYTFAAFFVGVLIAHRVAPPSARRWVLLVASYVFYGSWNAAYALLILGSTVVDYWVAGRIRGASTDGARKAYVTLSVAVNLGVLAVFKYFNFFSRSLAALFDASLPLHELLLPVGISFYTFQSMSYTLDVYRGRIPPARDFVDFALFVSFFPQLVAGPIVRAREFLPQIAAPQTRDVESIRFGLRLFFFGLFQKIVLADNLARWVDAVHADPTAYSSADLWASAYAFAFQIYFDFSGYSSMAIGLAALLGFRLPENFRRPYCAADVSDFWHRWHITLSTWLRDYLYIPLGGSRDGRWKTLRNLMITMVLGGLWHGAAWTFVAWGTLHGLFLVGHRLFRDLRTRRPGLDRLCTGPVATIFFVLLTFHCWTISMVLFRATSLDAALGMLGGMIGIGADAPARGGWVLLACAGLYALQALNERWDLAARFDDWPWWLRTATVVLGIWAMVLFTPTGSKPFIYFQF